MTTRIEREFSFQAGVYFKEEFLMNIYTVSLYMEVETESIREQNVAMERIKYFLNDCLENSIFEQNTEHKIIEVVDEEGEVHYAFEDELTSDEVKEQERSYSEEDVKNAFLNGWQLRDGDLPFPKAKKKWFEEIKKKS